MDHLPRPSLGASAREAMEKADFAAAVVEWRGDTTQYTIWHKSHTEPFLQAAPERVKKILDIDIKALSELVDSLVDCYRKAGWGAEIPAVLERLRSNVHHSQWQRKITYFSAVHFYLFSNDLVQARSELKKLEPMNEETDGEALQLYIDLFGRDLSFSAINELIDKLKRGIGFCKSMPGAIVPFERLHKRKAPKTTDRVFGKTQRELLNAVLDELDLKFDRDGNRRTAYAAPIWMTYRQAKELGGSVCKGEHGALVIYANAFTVTETNPQGEDIERDIPFMQGYTVFNVEQVEGLPAHYYAQPVNPTSPIRQRRPWLRPKMISLSACGQSCRAMCRMRG